MTSASTSGPAIDVSELHRALGSKHDAEPITRLLGSIGTSSAQAHISSFPDGSFHNYYAHGLSLFYTPDGSLDRLDLYNPSDEPDVSSSSSRRRRKPTTYSSAPNLIFNFPLTTVPIPAPPPRDPSLPAPKQSQQGEVPTSIERPERLVVDRSTTAKTLVECFGEPSKKVEGKAGWLETYMEWEVDILDTEGDTIRVGVLVELREGGGEGMSVWDRAQGWHWTCLKVFKQA